MTITSGFEESVNEGRRSPAAGADRPLDQLRGRNARVRLRQRAEVIVRVKKGKQVVRVLAHAAIPRKKLRFRWNGRIPKQPQRLEKAPRGRYKLQVLVLSDRKTVRRSRGVRIR